MAVQKIHVYECWSSDVPALMGCLYADTLRGKETCSFEYDPDWLKCHAHTFTLDPELQLYQGRQYAPLDKALFGLFADSCPDRWGRLLMRRREAIIAHREGRKPRQLLETDYLLGVHDVELAVEVASFFGICQDDAWKRAKVILDTVKRLWRPLAEQFGISRASQNAMAPAFSLCDQ